MKILMAAGLALSLATAAPAGNLTYVAPDAVTLEEPAAMGGSGAWLIPLVIVAVLILAMKGDDDGCPSQEGSIDVQC